MKIAFLATRLVKYDAISNYSMAVVKELSKYNLMDIYAFSIEIPIPAEITQSTYTKKKGHNMASVFLSAMKTYFLAKKLSKYDLLILCGPDITVLQSAHLAKRFNPDIKLIWDYHGLTPPQFLNRKDKILTFFRRYAFVKSMKRSDLILVRSEYIKKELRSAIGDRIRIRVVPFGIELERFKNIGPSDIQGKYHIDDRFVLLYVGRLAPHKRIDFLIRSLPKLDKDILLMIVGDGEEGERLKDLAHSLKVQDRVIFTGNVSDEDLQKYYAASDVFVTASLHEGFCVPIIEAFASGKPVIVPNITAMPEVAGDCGLVYDGSVKDFILKLQMLRNNDDLKGLLSKKVCERAKEFNIEEIVKRYENYSRRDLWQLIIFICTTLLII